MNRTVLSLFPGIGMLDAQFEAEAFCVVRGPDPLWGGDVRKFHPPAGLFDGLFDGVIGGVIGGPPCQDFSAARRSPPTGYGVEMLSEFCRVVLAAQPKWFVCENVPSVPDLEIDGYTIQRIDVEQAWWSGVRRQQLIQFGRHSSIIDASHSLDIPRGTIANGAEPCALACDERPFTELCRLQGLPDDFELPAFHDKARRQAVGNGVPALMGRKIAQAVRLAVYGESCSDDPMPTFRSGRRSCDVCERPVSGKQLTCSARCRKRRSLRAASRVTVTVAGESQ
ncbi:MAG: DNA (cytosine-5)-methyltransferase 1 [Planctomycetaceae bacterium]